MENENGSLTICKVSKVWGSLCLIQLIFDWNNIIPLFQGLNLWQNFISFCIPISHISYQVCQTWESWLSCVRESPQGLFYTCHLTQYTYTCHFVVIMIFLCCAWIFMPNLNWIVEGKYDFNLSRCGLTSLHYFILPNGNRYNKP
jgi:hypothetical protein